LLVASACNSGTGGDLTGANPTGPSTGQQPGTSAPVTLQTSSNASGEFVVDQQGRSLYLFEADSSGRSNCNGACAAAWPPLIAANGQAPGGAGDAQGGLAGVIARDDGTMQVTYKGMPLYYYAGDTDAGQTNGQGLDQFGALWYLVRPDGSALDNH
jgi:predicted lipoprotein with Yx(FWY)xxD motif